MHLKAHLTNDAILVKRGLKHLLFDTLVRRETQIFNELQALRYGLRTGQFIQVTDYGGFRQTKSRVWRDVERRNVIQVRYVPQAGEQPTHIDMTAEYAARRNERRLTAELAKIDALWAERAMELTKKSKTKGTARNVH